MGVVFTETQQRVIDERGKNLLISAAAGSGKTAVLVERIVKMVCDGENPVDIDRLLVVTFTNAAAAQMRERISRALQERLSKDPANEHLQRQTTLLYNAQITTIDSFCLFVLRNQFHTIGLDPGFRIGEEGEMRLLRGEVLARVLEEAYAQGDPAFLHAMEYFSTGNRDQAVENEVMTLYDFAMSTPFPEQWLNDRRTDYDTNGLRAPMPVQDGEGAPVAGSLLSLPWMEELLVHVRLLLAGCSEKLRMAQKLSEEPDGPYFYGELLERESEMVGKLVDLCAHSDYDSLCAAFSSVRFDRLPSKKDETVSPAKREAAKLLRGSVKDVLSELRDSFFAGSEEQICRQMEGCQAALNALLDLTISFQKAFEAAKREKNVLDFDDIEHLALQVLLCDSPGGYVPTETALAYRASYHEILIDEYQDSNLVQEYLLKAVSGEEDGHYNRFMVGDVKQSIYKFRLARPELFLEKYHTYSDKEGGMRRIDLHKNFRSRTQVIDTVNQVFGNIMTRELGGIVYDDAAALYAGAVYPENTGCESELILFEKPPKESEWNAKQVEAAGIAARIRKLKQEFLVTDKETGELRPVAYRDIVVLLRTNSGWDEEFRAVFEKEGIPAYVSGKTGYFAAKEIRDILMFLRVLDNPLQDIPLFGVMKSVFGGFSDEEAALVRSADKEGAYLYDCLRACAGESGEETGNTVLREKCRDFLEQIAKYRRFTAYMPIHELLKRLLSDYDYPAYVAALPAGSRRLANVEMLLTKAAGFEKNSYYGLFHFVRYMEQMEKYHVDYGEAGTLDENADVVRIMSIHKSKGLEFPVAFVAGLSKRFNMQDASQALIVDVDLGIGTDYVNPVRRIKSKTLRKNVLSAKLKQDNLAEELRVLYVAMTRAKEKLIMTGVVEEPQTRVEEERENGGEMTYTRLTGAACFLDYLLPVFPQVTVIALEELALSELKEGVDEGGRRLRLEDASQPVDEEALARLSERFAYEYPHKNMENLYTKTTVSELKKAAMEGGQEEPAKELFPQEEIKPYVPKFMREKEDISGTTRGSAVHRVMELLDFTRAYEDKKSVAEMMDAFTASGCLSEEYRGAVREDKIFRFLKTPLAERMRAAALAGKLYREQPFVYGISAARLKDKSRPDGDNAFPAEETVLIQGIVDAFFEEEDGLVLLDYKTDVIKAPEELVKRYKVQLDYYEEALESLTGKKVKERMLYSFYLGCVVPA